MKNLITYLKALWGAWGNLQSSDVSLDRRLTVGSPSGLDAKWKQNPFMRFAVVLTLIFSVGVGNVWGTEYTYKSFTTSFVKGSTNGTYVSSQVKTDGTTKLSTISDSNDCFTTNPTTVSNTYYNSTGVGLRISKSSGAGSIKFTLTDALKDSTIYAIVVYASKVSGNNKATLVVTPTAPTGGYTTITNIANGTLKAYSGSYGGTNSYYKLDTIKVGGKKINTLQFGSASGGYTHLQVVEIITQTEKAAGCSNNVGVTKGTENHGEITTISSASVATCSATASDRRVTITVTPEDCYDAPSTLTWTKSSGTVSASKQSGPKDNGDGTYSYVYQFAQNDNGAGTFGVTCTAKAAGKTVNFDAGPGSCLTSSLTETCDGSGVTLPAVTATGVCKGWTTFAGWATAAVSDSTTTSGVTLYAAGDNFVPASNGQTLYAVYSKNKGGGASTSTLTNSSIVSSGNSSGYKTYCTSGCNKSPIDGWSGKFAVNYVSSGTHYSVQLGRATTSGASAYNTHLTSPTYASGATHISLTLSTSASQVTANGRKFYLMDTDELNYTAADQTSSYGVGTYDNSDDNYEVSFDVTGSPTQFHIYADGTAYIKTITVTYGGSTTYYCSDPNCCTPLGSINGSVSWTNPTQAVVTWDKLDDQVSAWALSWSPNTVGSSITSAIADYGLTQKTATVSGLACGTEYTFTLTPTLKSGVCTPASNPTIESTSTKYSITKASVTGGSFTTKISSTAVTEACNSSTISIAATPSTGYTFSSWMITNDDNSDADVTSTLLGANSTTASTTFTMPSHRVTITPSFSCIEPVIGTNPASASYTEGASPSALTVAATLSSGTLTYKWQKSTNSGVSWTDESGTGYNTATYAAANISTSLSANGVQYRCIVGNSEGGCTVTSGVATITVTAASKCVAPTFDPVAGTYNSSQTVTISSSTSGSTIYYTTNGSTPTTSSSHGTEGEASASVTVSSSLTLKAIAYKGGMTTSDVSDAAYVICSTDPSFSTTSSSNITITGARVTCAGITKGTCDIDAYGIVYGTSEHPTGNAQQKGTDASTNVSSYYVDLTGLTAATTYYARPYATVNGKTVYGTEISFTTLHIPEITVSETSRAFGTKKVDGSYEMSFTVSGSYLQSNIGLAISGTNEAMFSVDKTSLTPSTGTVGSTTVTVTYTPSAAGSHSATVSITSTNATTKTVTLSGTGQYEDTYMTAMHEGVDAWEDYAEGVTKAGDGYTIPNPGDIEAGDREGTGCEGIHYHFAGWVEETYKASPSGHIVAASGTKDASNKTFWAVWEKEAAGGGDPITATITQSALYNDGEVYTQAYADDPKTHTDNQGNDWSVKANSQKTGTYRYIQMRTYDHKDGVSYIQLPDYPGNISSIVLTVSSGGGNTPSAGSNTTTLYLCADAEANVTSPLASATGASSITLSPSSSVTTGYIKAGGGIRIWDMSVTYATISYEDPKVECVCSVDPSAGTAAVDAEGTFSASSIAVKATGASTGHTDCSYTDYGFVWSSSVSAAADLKLVEGTGAAAANCTKLQEGTSGEETSFTGSISGSFTANTPIYFRAYVKNGKADGTYQYSSVVTITPRSVTFNLNGHGSSAPVAQFVNNGSKATDPSYSESVTGYIFGGWYKEVGCTNQWNFASDVVSGESKTLYAKWTPISYSVRFNDNDENYLGDATGSMSNQSFDYDEEKALTTNAFSLAGYDFAGWALTADGDVAYTDGASASNLSSTNSDVVDLYAIWTAKSYDVTLAATNETSSVGSQTVTATYNAAMPTTKKGSGDVVAPSRTGYTFTGWEYSSTTYYNYDAGTSTLSSAHVWDQPNSTTTLTPKWSINSYTLTWNLGGGTVATAGTGAEEGATGTPSSSVVYNSAITVPTVTKAGYNFAGWDVTPASKMPASNVTYTATWTAKTLNSISLAEASVSVYVGEIKYVNVIFDPTDILSKAFSQSATPSYCQLNSYDSYNKLKITGGRSGADISVNRTETVSIKYTADETKTASISVTVKPLPTVTFVDLIHNKSDFANSGDGWTAGTGVLSSTVTTGVVSHAKKTPTHTDVSAPVGGNACETGHLHLMGWIRSDYEKVAAYMAGTGAAPTVSELTSAGTGYWFTPNADINVETYNGKTFYAVWAVEE